MIDTVVLLQAGAGFLIMVLSMGGMVLVLKGAGNIHDGWGGQLYFWSGGLMMGVGLSALFTLGAETNFATAAVLAAIISAVSYVGAYWLMRLNNQ